MNRVESVGLIGSILTSLSYLPQVIKSRHSKDLSGVSIWNPIVGLVSGAFWLYYAVALEIMPVLFSTVFIGGCNIALILMKVICDRDTAQNLPATALVDFPLVIDNNSH